MPAQSQINRRTSNVLTRTTRNSTRNVTSDNGISNISTKTNNGSLHVGKLTKFAAKTENDNDAGNKRKAESPHANKQLKRLALTNLTNAIKKPTTQDSKEPATKKSQAVKSNATTTSNTKKTATKTAFPAPVCTKFLRAQAVKPTTVATATTKLLRKSTCKLTNKVTESNLKTSTTIKTKPLEKKEAATACTLSTIVKKADESLQVTEIPVVNKPVTRKSLRLSDVATTSSDDDSSLYVTALDELNLTEEKPNELKEPTLPPGVEDFDKENWDDPFQLSHYAVDIFNYLKSREGHYQLSDYMKNQVALNQCMRSLLVDWLVEVQENFELTHETLYLGVKIVDKYLSKQPVTEHNLQLVGATSMYIASKFDECSPPLLEDIVYIADNLYTAKNILDMEASILKSLDFDLGFPLSYSFLRRYARCSRAPMELLTLARFVLEYALLEYPTITLSDSKMAAASLHIARLMKKVGGWTTTLEYYSGYKRMDFIEIAFILNDILHKKPRTAIKTIRNKYSHESFFGVAKTPLIENSEL